MKKSYSLCVSLALALLVGLSHPLMAQRTVSGKVVDETGALPGVNVLLKGTTNGTVTNGEGVYSLSVSGDNPVLVFSSIGFATQEIAVGSRSSIDITLAQDVQQLSEVVVTALGIQRETKALQYSVTDVKGENFTQARENNLAAALSGRIAGVNVTKAASGPAGSSRVVIRGNKSLAGQNQPLYVIDGIPMDNSNFGQAGLWGGRDEGDGLSSINPDDIESITVLKGANAAALYGARGGNGVINIVTKKGTARKGLGIEFNSNYVMEKAINMSDMQQKYGSGAYVDGTTDGIANGVATKPDTPQRAFNWSNVGWGPALDGSPSVQWDGVTRPYSNTGDNWDKYYRNGSALTNSLALSGGSDQQTFRFSVSDLRSEAIIPNSGFDRTNLSLATNGKFGEKLTFNAKVMYTHESAKNRPTLSDSPMNAVQTIWRIPLDYDVTNYRGSLEKQGAIPAGTDPALLLIYGQGGAPKAIGDEWLPAANNWGQNPYWAAYQYIDSDIRDRFISSAQLRYDITSFLYASGRFGLDSYTRRDQTLTPQGTGYNLGGAMTEGIDKVYEYNAEWILGFDKAFDKIQVNAFVGGNLMRRKNERISANGTGFNVPYFGAINNSTARNYGFGFSQSGINSVFGSAEVSYNGIFFLTATARKDWFSVLNPEFNSQLYPSVGASFVFSDAFSNLPSFLSFGKVRASWAQVATAFLNPYAANLTYSLNGASHLGRPMATFSSAGGNNGTIPNPSLQPALSTELEFGFDLRAFNNRVGLDFTYYSQKTTDDILAVTISRASGFGSTFVNIGELENKGFEILLTGTPVKGDVTWDVSFNIGRNKNKVVALAGGATEIVAEEPRTRNVFIKHIVGQPFGTITGRVQQTAPDGTPLYMDTGGRMLASTAYTPIGNGIADATGGLNNSFTWKGVNLSFLIDFKIGGDIFSGTNNRLTNWGFHKQTLTGRDGEAPLHITGAIRSGSGATETYTPIDTDLTAHQSQIYWNAAGGEGTAISTLFMYDATYVKLRQLTLGYSLPKSMLSKTPFQNVTVSLVGRNLALLFRNIENVDPESAYSTNAGAQGLEYFAMPTTRSMGFNLRLNF